MSPRLKFDKRPKAKKKSPRKFSSIRKPSFAESKARAAAAPPRKPVKKKSRKPSEFARIYGSQERVAWVKRQPCIVATGVCRGPIEGHHTKNGGQGRKADARTIAPLCADHHLKLHTFGRRTFEAFYNVPLETAAAKTHLKWLEFSAAGGRGAGGDHET